MTRIALITEIISPYRIPVFNALNSAVDGGLHVIFLSETEGRRSWPVYRDEMEFSFEVLGGLRFGIPYYGDSIPLYLSRPVASRLRRGGFDAVLVGGWNHISCYEALAWCKLRNKKFALWSETPLLGPSPSRPLRTIFKRAVVSRADGFAVPGVSAGRYLSLLGAAPERIHVAPNAVDNTFWSAVPPGLPKRERLTLLYVGRLVSAKGIDLALAAFAGSQLAGKADFLIAGDGPFRAALERLAGPDVRFLGSQNRDELRVLYHSVDMLVLPTLRDVWGLVLNEAACARVAAIVSDAAGAAHDMIRDGESGVVVEVGSVNALRSAFDRVAGDPSLPRRLGNAANELMKVYTPEACAAGLLASVT